jgi:hypothetical protein
MQKEPTGGTAHSDAGVEKPAGPARVLFRIW